MDNQAYLNQISAKAKPSKKTSKLFSSNLGKILGIGVTALAIVLILSAIISSLRKDVKTLSITLQLRLDKTSEIINEYQPSVKSSELRSYSATLASIIDSTSSDLATMLSKDYDIKKASDQKDIVKKVEATMQELSDDLFEAKINGLLDRTYARKMAYEISLIQNYESEIYHALKNGETKESLESSYDSLSNLYESFNSFSEAKK